jgi:hypothetical protein
VAHRRARQRQRHGKKSYKDNGRTGWCALLFDSRPI